MDYFLLSLLHPFRSSFPGQILRSEQCDTRSSRPKDMACSAFGSLWLTPMRTEVGRSAKCKVAKFLETQKACVIPIYDNLFIMYVLNCCTHLHRSFNMSGRAAKISRSSKESSCGEDGQIPGCNQINRKKCGTQKMLKSERSGTPSPDLFSSRSSAAPAPRYGWKRPSLINAESHLVPEVHTDPPCTNG